MSAREKFPCQTPGARWHTEITERSILVRVDLAWPLPLSRALARNLEDRLHHELGSAISTVGYLAGVKQYIDNWFLVATKIIARQKARAAK